MAPIVATGTGSSALLAIGVAALCGTLGWRWWQAYAVRHRIRQALADQSADIRRTGVELAVDRGLAASAEVLLRVARDEADPEVLAALVQAIAKRQWEPASTPRIVELRLWAKAYVDAHQELQPPAQRRPGDARAADLAQLGEAVPEAAPTGIRVLVTGAGGPAGVAVIRDLRAHGHHVIAVDSDPMAVGLRLAHQGFTVARADDPSYLAPLWRVITETDPHALLCTVAEEYAALVPAREMLAEARVRTLMPALPAVEACIDKWRFAEVTRDRSLPVPPTGLGEAAGVPGPPWVVKPRHGRGSRDVHVVTDKRSLAAALRATPEPIVQPLLPGREFTADALVDGDGEVLAVVPRWRLETKAGISTKGRTFDDPEVAKAVAQVLAAVGLVGPANVQGFVDDDGNVAIHEVNPRFSGGLPLSLHAGAELVEQYLQLVLGQPVCPERLVHRPDVVMLRHFAEVFEG